MEDYQTSQVIPERFSAKETAKRKMWHCPDHRHTGLSSGHMACYNRVHGIEERKVFVDIETTNLKANFGVILTWCAKDISTGQIHYDYMTHEDVEEDTADKRIVQTLIDTMWGYDRIVGHFSTYFDVPFIRTRAIHWDLDYPEYGMFYHTDTWKMAKKLLCLHSNRQDSVAQAVQHKSCKTRINPDIWAKVLFGSKKQRTTLIKEVLHHNEQDVIEGCGNYLAMLKYYKELKSKI